MKIAWLLGEWVGKVQFACQELERAGVVTRRGVVDGGVEAVVANGDAQRRHVYAQLVAFAGNGFKLVQAPVLAVGVALLQQGDLGGAVGGAGRLLHAEEFFFVVYQPTLVQIGCLKTCVGRCDGLVDFAYGPCAKQVVVGVARVRVVRE